MPLLIASDAKLQDGKVVGDPTEGALLVLGSKARVNIDSTRELFPRLATLPFDPTLKLMATFNSVTDNSGTKVVRCYVKGVAPAVLQRAATALSGGTLVPWDKDLQNRAEAGVERLEGEGLRVMAAAYRDLDPATFRADGDLLGYVTDLTMTSLVGMIDPSREESKTAVANAQAAHIKVRMVTGDDVITGTEVAKNAGRMILSDDKHRGHGRPGHTAAAAGGTGQPRSHLRHRHAVTGRWTVPGIDRPPRLRTGGSTMPLSKDEQRRLDEIEQALRDDDPLFAATVTFDHLRRHRLFVGSLVFLGGLMVLVVGEIAAEAQLAIGVIVSVGGFVAMLAAAGWTLHRPLN